MNVDIVPNQTTRYPYMIPAGPPLQLFRRRNDTRPQELTFADQLEKDCTALAVDHVAGVFSDNLHQRSLPSNQDCTTETEN